MNKKLELRVHLEEEFQEKIKMVKNYYGIKNNTELIRFLITERYREITENKSKKKDK